MAAAWRWFRGSLLLVALTWHASGAGSGEGFTSVGGGCIDACLSEGRGCRSCVSTLAHQHLVVPRALELSYAKAHAAIPTPGLAIEHHSFAERPPRGAPHHAAALNGKTHADCPAMRARSGVGAITIKMPYTARFFRNGSLEVVCDWLVAENGSAVPPTTRRFELPAEGVDSPWFRLPQSHLHVFTIGDTRAGVWIINSGIYVDDTPWQGSAGAAPGDKGGSSGIKWLVQPLPHRSFPLPTKHSNNPTASLPLWQIEQGVLSSFQRVSQSANIPVQLNFHLLSPSLPRAGGDADGDTARGGGDANDDACIEILKGTPMLQYLPAALPSLSLHERLTGLDPGLVEYLVELSLIHKGGDYRKLGVVDQGASSIMKSHTLTGDNPGDKNGRPEGGKEAVVRAGTGAFPHNP